MISIFSYWQTENLGDAIQAIALSRLLNPVHSFRDRDTGIGATPQDLHLCNGYLDERWAPANAARSLFVGVHVKSWEVVSTLLTISNRDTIIGARDQHTHALLQARGLRSEFVGCATLTLPRYEGPREGEVHIDSGNPEELTQWIPQTMPWKAQWWHATERLLLLQRAKLVITRRLHVALPCLAYGTPVLVPEDSVDRVSEPARLGLLESLGFRYGVPQIIDVGVFAANYVTFLHERLSANRQR
jgi:Polysaccharide pyruvyl transferase